MKLGVDAPPETGYVAGAGAVLPCNRGLRVVNFTKYMGLRYNIRRLLVWRRGRHLTIPRLLEGIDPAELTRLQEYKARENREDVFWTKYLDIEKWLNLNIRYAHELGLITNPPKSVLDVGCGGGYFLLVCRKLGARVLGVDLDKDKVLNDLIKLFGIRRIVWEIKAFEKLPELGAKFDLITAFMICFNFPPAGGYWGVREWDFFLHDMTSYLLPGGRLLLSLNQQPDGECYDETLKRYFESRGGAIKGKRIIFTEAGLRLDYPPVPPAPALTVAGG